ncbi:MAG: FtsX-like permease family protein [Gammaproteobacteria bacterium]|nr:FtsX-like permease family protein [Gammaproteobacteria bacterium]
MRLGFQIREAWLNFSAAKLRFFLAILGILIGTASVVAMLSGGKIATAQVLKQFKALGTDLMAVHFIAPRHKTHATQPISIETLLGLSRFNSVTLVAPYTMQYRSITLPEGKSMGINLLGVTQQFAEINKIPMAQGRFVHLFDNNAPYAVIGDTFYKKIRAHTFHNIIGQQLKIGQRLFTIIGIMKPAQNNPFVFQDLNNGIIVPLKTLLTSRRDASIDYLLLKLQPNSNIDQVQQQLSRYLKGRNPQQRLIFHSAKRLIEGMVKQKKVLTLFLGFIGGISLLVGGIGVMNIMLVSVTERRQEIGIRMAIGARRYDIQLLFLIEAVTLSIVGGLLGILCGIIVTAVIAELNHWDFTLFLSPIVLGFTVSAAMGIFFGWYPAFKASRVDPITCLHAE